MTIRKKGGLGRGLNALISEPGQKLIEDEMKNSAISENSIVHIDINKITPNRKQPRKSFEEEGLKELADSIKLHGILQPIIVKAVPNGYEIIAGERRWRASKLAELKTMPCILRSDSEQSNLLVALIENLQREQLNPMDESSAYQFMSETFGMTQDEIAKNVGKSRPYVANSMRLQKLPDIVKTMLIENSLSAGHGRALLSVQDMDVLNKLARKCHNENLSVRELEDIIKNLSAGQHKTQSKHRPASQFTDIESDIKESIGAKVKIKEKNDKGTIQLSFYSRDELERLVELLLSFK